MHDIELQKTNAAVHLPCTGRLYTSCSKLVLCIQVAARALQLHPTQAQLWIRAASWEFDQRASAAAARCACTHLACSCVG